MKPPALPEAARTLTRVVSAPHQEPQRLSFTSTAWPAFTLLWLAAILVATSPAAQAQEVVIQSLSRNGLLTWTNAPLGSACRVEWAPTLDAPWQSAWDTLVDVPITNLVTERVVPMFYRVVSYPMPAPVVTPVTASAALAVVAGRQADDTFIILDVRMPSEYATGHMKTALNVNFYSTAFEQTLRKLDRKKTYLVYCASGSRSAKATDKLRSLGFLRIDNMTEGYVAFAALPGANQYTE